MLFYTFCWYILKLLLSPSKSVPPEDINVLNSMLPNILKNIQFTSEFNRNDFGIICDFDFDTFGFISTPSLSLGIPEVTLVRINPGYIWLALFSI